MNTVYLTGNAVETPIVRETKSGRKVTNLRLAAKERYQKDGEWQDSVSFCEITLWGYNADMAGHLQRGDPCFVVGRLQNDSWTDKKTGDERQKLKVVAKEFEFLERMNRVETQDDANREMSENTDDRKEDDTLPF